MGLDELTIAFCQAGVRASDLPARATEAAAFAAAAPPVELWPNSRFGIGAMSYFMIADAVTVVSARLEPSGSIGHRLSMHIAGPAESFDVLDHGPSTQHGTRVRLWLKPSASVSAISTLRDLVIVSPVHLRVGDERGLEHRWAPDELNSATSKLEVSRHTCAPGIPGELWWVHAKAVGAVLADGIWAGTWLSGMVVNLRGRYAPTLTADRQKIVRLDQDAIESLAISDAESAVESAWPIVGDPDWLSSTTRRFPRLADAIVAGAAERGDRSLVLHGVEVDIASAGYLPGDEEHAPFEDGADVLRWRFSRLAAGGQYAALPIGRASGILPGRPSDAVILGTLSLLERYGSDEHPSRWFSSTASIYEAERLLRIPLRDVVTRARELGLPVSGFADRLLDSNTTVRTVLSLARRQNADGSFRPVSAFDLQQAGWQLGKPIQEIIAELDSRFIEFDEAARTISEIPLSTADLIMVSAETSGIAPWLDSSQEVGLGHVVRAARATGRTCDDVVRGLRALGFVDLPAIDLARLEPSDDDVIMLSRDLDGEAPSLSADRAVSEAHLRAAARALDRSEADVRQRLREFGITVSDGDPLDLSAARTKKELVRALGLPELKGMLRGRHLRMISRDGDGAPPWLNQSVPVPAWLVATTALHRDSIDEVIANYRRLGYQVEDPRIAPFAAVPGGGAPTM